MVRIIIAWYILTDYSMTYRARWYTNNEQARKAIVNLVNGCSMSLERELTAGDLVRLDRYGYSTISNRICVVFINLPFINIGTSLSGTTFCDVKSMMRVSMNVCLR